MFGRKSREDRTGYAEVVDQQSTVAIGELALNGAGFSEIRHFIDSLAPQLAEFQNEWDITNILVSDFLEEKGNRDLFSNALDDFRQLGPEGVEVCGEHTIINRIKLSASDLERMVATQLIVTRATSVSASLRSLNDEGIGGSLRDMMQAKKVVQQASLEASSQWEGVKALGCQHTPNANSFFKQLNNLGERVGPHYRKSDKIRGKIESDLVGLLSKSPEQAQALLDSLEDLSISEDPNHQTLLRIVATDYLHHHNDGSESLIDIAINTIESAAPEGGMVNAFLSEQAADETHWVHFVNRMYQRLGGQATFIDFMKADLHNWPESWQYEYNTFVRERLSSLRTRTKRDLQRHVDSQFVIPTLGEAFEEANRIFLALGATPLEKVRKRRTRQDSIVSKGLHSSSRVLPREHAFSAEGAKKKKVGVISRVIGQSGADNYKYAEVKTIDDFIKDFIGEDKRLPDPEKYGQELRSMISRIAEQPYGEGTQRIESRTIRLGGNRIRIRRLNPNHAPGLSTPTAQDSRIIYAVDGDTIAVLGIFTNHNEYERAIKNIGI